jgi:hypothetical protein
LSSESCGEDSTTTTRRPCAANAASKRSTPHRPAGAPVLDHNRPDLGVTQKTGQCWASPVHTEPGLVHDLAHPKGVAPTPRRHSPGLRLQSG